MRQERVGGCTGLGTNRAPAVKEPSGSGYLVRVEQGEGATWHEITLLVALVVTG